MAVCSKGETQQAVLPTGVHTTITCAGNTTVCSPKSLHRNLKYSNHNLIQIHTYITDKNNLKDCNDHSSFCTLDISVSL